MKKILLVDNNQKNLFMLEVLFKSYGYGVETAKNGEEALEKAREKPPILVIADILMPVMDGFTLCRKWKQDSELNTIPFVFYTATYTEPKDKEFALSLGADRFIIKPAEPDDFIKIILEVIEEHMRGKVTSPLNTEAVEGGVLRQYNAHLVKKLEDKLFQLEEEVKLRTQAQAALEESEEKLRNVIEQAVDGVAITDEKGMLIEWNDSIAAITGYKAEKILGQYIWDIQFQWMPEGERTPEALEILKRFLQNALKTGDLPRAEELMEREYQHPDGSFCTLQGSIFPIKTDKGFMLGSFTRDISQHKLVEEKHQKVLQSTKDGYLLVNILGKIEEVNEATCEMSGYSQDELLRLTIMDIDGEMSPKAVLKKLKELYQSKGGYFTTKLLRKDSSLVDVELSVKLAAIDGGRLVAFARDISERKREEETLRESEERLKEAQQIARIGSWEWDMISGDVSWSDQMYSLLRYDPGKVEPSYKLARSHVHPDDLALYDEKMEQAINKQTGIAFENRIICADQTQIWVYSQGNAICDKSNKPVRMVGTVQDITERKQTEMELLESETRYRGIFEGVQDAILVESSDGDILDVNERACQIFGYSREEFLMKNVKDIVPPGGEMIIIDHFATGELPNRPIETVNIRANGEEFPVEISGRMYKFEDEEVLLVVLRDITERKQAEETIREYANDLERLVEERTIELTHANRAKDEFLANMSHELRTPLNSVLVFSESLLEQRFGPLNEKQEQYVQLIASGGHHLLGLINDILDVSKIEAGKLDVHPDTISVKDVCVSSLSIIKEMAARKSISIKFRNRQSISTLRADPKRLKQILVNLLNNAVKFAPEKGKVSLEVTANADKDQIQFSVSDNGIGIASDDLSKLFTPFTQLDSDLSRQYEGTGLGLVIVYKLTEMHGGSVQVQSEPGIGSRFTIILPWSENETEDQKEDSISSIQSEAVDEPESISGKRGIILLAEDNSSNALPIQDYFEGHGYQVIVAQNGLEAIAMAEISSPNIILMDIQMPELDGLEAIRRLRADSRFTSIPIIALTALAMSGDRESCLEAGANEYISKPVRLKKLKQMLESFL